MEEKSNSNHENNRTMQNQQKLINLQNRNFHFT